MQILSWYGCVNGYAYVYGYGYEYGQGECQSLFKAQVHAYDYEQKQSYGYGYGGYQGIQLNFINMEIAIVWARVVFVIIDAVKPIKSWLNIFELCKNYYALKSALLLH